MTIIRITAEQPNLALITEELRSVQGIEDHQIKIQTLPSVPGELGHADWTGMVIDLSIGITSGVTAGAIIEGVKAVVANARRRGQVELEIPEANAEDDASPDDAY